mmetsp:Transcript_71505/g.232383  ORF Transcript_71505/g.232383 Transcript_71505/m.232383 type:complete len:277 (-) Transcript_71505:93-923(-)
MQVSIGLLTAPRPTREARRRVVVVAVGHQTHAQRGRPVVQRVDQRQRAAQPVGSRNSRQLLHGIRELAHIYSPPRAAEPSSKIVEVEQHEQLGQVQQSQRTLHTRLTQDVHANASELLQRRARAKGAGQGHNRVRDAEGQQHILQHAAQLGQPLHRRLACGRREHQAGDAFPEISLRPVIDAVHPLDEMSEEPMAASSTVRLRGRGQRGRRQKKQQQRQHEQRKPPQRGRADGSNSPLHRPQRRAAGRPPSAPSASPHWVRRPEHQPAGNQTHGSL